jgi:CheY-like chemotaxis protein
MPKILVADDDFYIREFIKTVLESQEYWVDTAENGQQALEKLRQNHFDLAILDMKMPILDGLDALRIIRHDARLQKLPVLVCTNVTVTREVEDAFKAGANGYIVKTMLDAKKILDKVKVTLGV